MKSSPEVLSIIPHFYTFTKSFKVYFYPHLPSELYVLHLLIFTNILYSQNSSPGLESFILRLATREGS